MSHGGARPGAGRKPKVDEEKIRGLAVAAIEKKYGGIQQGFEKLLESNEPSLIKFAWEHAVGKPRDKMDIDLDSPLGPSVIINTPAGIDINLPDNTEESDQLEEDAEGSTPVRE